MITRGDRIAERQKQCTGCQYLSSTRYQGRSYGYCSAQHKRLCDMDIWEKCKDYQPKKVKQKEDFGEFLEKTRRVTVALNNKLKHFIELLKDPESTELLLKSLRTEFRKGETPTDAAIKEYLHKLQRSLSILFVTLKQLKDILCQMEIFKEQ